MQKLLFFLCVAALLVACTKQVDEVNPTTVPQLAPYAVGKSWLYRLDSTIAPAFGAGLRTRSYQCLDTVTASFSDINGNTQYRIFRLIRDTAGTTPWVNSGTIVVTYKNNNLEWSENNLRFINLAAPVVENTSWKGNIYIDTKSINSPWRYLDEWNYTYQNVLQPYTVGSRTFDSTVTVLQADETIPDAPFNPNNFQQKNLGVEVWAKGIGLVYKEFLHYTYQVTPVPGYEEGSYGIRLRLISSR
ncbi:MAG: hypothetical protein EAY72_14050 [Bacteroidetes bacterium]|nr:MAG: hypothetical protein EAY72_14050 [Bacteroidota bacterium]